MICDVSFQTHSVQFDRFTFACGKTLNGVPARYTIYGDLHKNRERTILVGHGFSCNSELHTWWGKFFDKLDLDHYAVVCINSLGSPHGALSPLSRDPLTQSAYGVDFPNVVIEDNARYLKLVLDFIGINNFHCAIGCSLGGFEFLELLRLNVKMNKLILAGASGLGLINRLLHKLQINMIEDGVKSANPQLPNLMMSYVRAIDRLSYTSDRALLELGLSLAQDEPPKTLERYFYEDRMAFIERFSPLCYRSILQSIVSLETSKERIFHDYTPTAHSPAILFVGVQNDSYTPAKDVKTLQTQMAARGYRTEYRYFETKFGHEAWILDGERFHELIKDFF